MIEMNEELIKWFGLFKKQFDDIVPMRQISGGVTNEQLIDAIRKSIESNANLLPDIFGYGDMQGRTY